MYNPKKDVTVPDERHAALERALPPGCVCSSDKLAAQMCLRTGRADRRAVVRGRQDNRTSRVFP